MSANNERNSFLRVHACESCCAIDTNRSFRGTMSLLLRTLLIAGMFGITGCGSGGSGTGPVSGGSGSSSVSGGSGSSYAITNEVILPTQKWTLTSDTGDVAYVIIVPFTATGTFTESSNSPGWWLKDSNNNPVARIPLNGTVTHSEQNDTWDFTISELSGGVRLTGAGTGMTTDGAYPAARNVHGTVSETTTSPAGTQSVLRTWSWSGNNYSAWN